MATHGCTVGSCACALRVRWCTHVGAMVAALLGNTVLALVCNLTNDSAHMLAEGSRAHLHGWKATRTIHERPMYGTVSTVRFDIARPTYELEQ